MRFSFLAGCAGAMLAAASPAGAQSFVSGVGSVTLDRTAPFSWTVDLGATNGNGLAGTRGSIAFDFLSANASGTTWNFAYSVDNVSVAPSAGSELSSFGFDTSGTERSVSAGAGNLFSAALNTGNFNGLGNRDLCFLAGPNCNGGGSRGVGVALAPVAGTFSVSFTGGQNTLTLSDFVARWQSTGANLQGSASGTGTITPAVPEPGTWAMMLLGFGAIGYAMRRRRADMRVALAG